MHLTLAESFPGGLRLDGSHQLFPEEIEIPIYTETKFYQVMNRYGQPIRFIESESGFMMKGGDYYRYLFNEGDDGYYAVDPSGGPFISVGTDLSIVHKKISCNRNYGKT